jgi:hypothetical protein
MKIFKYKLQNNPIVVSCIHMPKDAKIIRCEYQRCIDNWDKVDLCIWAVVNPKLPKVMRRFMVLKTGESIPLHTEHIATVIGAQGQFITHVFELFNN